MCTRLVGIKVTDAVRREGNWWGKVQCGLCGMEVLATRQDMNAHAEFHIEMRYTVVEKYNIGGFSHEPIIFKHFNKETDG